MKFDLLATKFHPPTLSDRRVMRTHLKQRLQDGLESGKPLTLVSAPAGFGKTTCVGEWAAGLTLPVVWLSLDNNDDTPQQFFTYFIAALQKIDSTIANELAAVFRGGQTPRQDLTAAALINDIERVGQRFLVILDDFHLIQERYILDVLEKLIVSGQQQLHLAIITREDPPLPLGRMRANNLITEIRVSDLRFSSAESSTLLNERMGLSLSSSDIALLGERTEGWAAGLQLAGLSIRGRSDPSTFIANLSGSHRFILSYLTEEVLSRQTEDVQTFLLHTSILEKLTGELCDQITGRNDSAALLERLLSANLFLIPLDDDQRWYRYHHLFADLLRSQQARISREQTRQLHSRAAAWYQEAGLVSEAIQHALAGEDYATAIHLLEKHTLNIVMQGNAKIAEGWIKALPEQWQSQNPKANLAFAWLHLVRGNYAEVPAFLQQSENSLQQANLSQPEIIAVQAEWLTLRANLLQMQGNPAESAALARQALTLIQPDEYYIRGSAALALASALRQMGHVEQAAELYHTAIEASRTAKNPTAEMLAISSFTLMAIDQGQLHFAYDLGEDAIQRIARPGAPLPPIIGVVYAALGAILYEWNRLDKAREFFDRALYLGSFSGHNASLVNVYINIARLEFVQGNTEAAEKNTRQTLEMLPGAPNWFKPQVCAQLVAMLLLLDNLPAAEAVLLQNGLALHSFESTPPPPVFFSLALLRLALHRARQTRAYDELPAAVAQLRQMLPGAIPGAALKLLLLLAQIQMTLGQTQDSLETLEQALALAEPEDYQRAFIDEGPEMAALLRLCLGSTARPAYAKKILAAFPAQPEPPAAGAGLIEPLTERELEVIGWMAQGLKYEEIAARMFISVNTVRFYVKEIYGKLGVNNRTRAIEIAHQLNLL